MRRISRWIGFYLLLFMLLVPAVAYQQQPFVNCNPLEGQWCTLADLVAIPARIFNYLLLFAGPVLLMVVAWGGAKLMLFHFSDAPESELEQAKQTIRHGIAGIVIVALAYIIVNVLLCTFLGINTQSFVARTLQAYGLLRGCIFF